MFLGTSGSSPASAAGKSLIIKGSDTMVILGQAWAEAYMQKHPNVDISVQGGGSGTGIAALINNTLDICEASRPMSAAEISKARDRNIFPVATAVALDGISIAVNSSNPVHSLTLDQLKDIYTGKVKNWKEVGGKNAPIVVLSRESSSGTYVYFQEHVLENQKYANTVLLMPSTKAIQAEVTNNPNAIGYGGVAYFKEAKNVKLVFVANKRGGESIEPTDANVKSKKYPISRELFFYTSGKPKGQIADFVKFCLSPEGQQIVTEVGYVSMH